MPRPAARQHWSDSLALSDPRPGVLVGWVAGVQRPRGWLRENRWQVGRRRRPRGCPARCRLCGGGDRVARRLSNPPGCSGRASRHRSAGHIVGGVALETAQAGPRRGAPRSDVTPAAASGDGQGAPRRASAGRSGTCTNRTLRHEPEACTTQPGVGGRLAWRLLSTDPCDVDACVRIRSLSRRSAAPQLSRARWRRWQRTVVKLLSPSAIAALPWVALAILDAGALNLPVLDLLVATPLGPLGTAIFVCTRYPATWRPLLVILGARGWSRSGAGHGFFGWASPVGPTSGHHGDAWSLHARRDGWRRKRCRG